MSKPPSSKPDRLFPAPEWTGVSAQMAASLAHEIRNPLLSIRGAAQLLLQGLGTEDRPLAELIIAEVGRIDRLVGTLDPLTPNPPQEAVALNIHEITEYVRLAARSFAGEVAFVADYDPSLPPILGMREPLIQAVMNLIKNAVEALDGVAQPTITFTTRYLIGERMQRVGGGKLSVQLSIADNGPGVAPALVPRLFTPFTTDKEGGKGLGLAIVAKIMEEHGGLVAHDAPQGGGARFTLYLPAAV